MSSMNLTLQQAAGWVENARLVGDAGTCVARVHSDTRSLMAGDLFVALRGERFDAASFLPEAARLGAAAALVDEASLPLLQQAGLPGLLVPDARRALGQLATGWRRQFSLPLIAVTGSNGKTTVTQMAAAILRAWQGEAMLATQGNFNNDIGVPLTLLRLRAVHRAAVVELGMNHPGEIAQLAAMAQPTVALVNNAQREHQEFMASVAAVARENGAVLAALPADGVAVYPADDPYQGLWQSMSAGAHHMPFGGPGARVALREASWCKTHWQVQADTPAGSIAFELHAAGRHNLHNALAAAACGVAAGVPAATVAAGLSAFRPVQGRTQLKTLHYRGRALTLVDDTYNANPDSVRALIDLLATLPAPRLLVLGDMGEVGEQGVAFHAEVGAYARQCGIEHLLAHGPLSIHAAMAFGRGRHFDQLPELTNAVRTHLAQEAVASIAVKGSRFMQMEKVVQALAGSDAAAKEEGTC